MEGGGVLQGAWVGRRSCFIRTLLYFFGVRAQLLQCRGPRKKNALRLEDPKRSQIFFPLCFFPPAWAFFWFYLRLLHLDFRDASSNAAPRPFVGRAAHLWWVGAVKQQKLPHTLSAERLAGQAPCCFPDPLGSSRGLKPSQNYSCDFSGGSGVLWIAATRAFWEAALRVGCPGFISAPT